MGEFQIIDVDVVRGAAQYVILLSAIVVPMLVCVVVLPLGIQLYDKLKNKVIKGIFTVVMLMLILAAIFGAWTTSWDYQTIHVRLTVRVDDGVNIDEAFEGYDIISHEGNIYVIERSKGV